MLVADTLHLGVSDLLDIESEGRRCFQLACSQRGMNLAVEYIRRSGECILLGTDRLEAHKPHPEGCNLLDTKSEGRTRHSEVSCQPDTALEGRRYYPVGCNQRGTDHLEVHTHRLEE